MRKVMIAGLVIAAWWWWRGGDPPDAGAPRIQAAVLPDGFAVLLDRRIRELDRDAAVHHELPLQLATEVRLVGTRAGTTVGWQDGKQIKLATLDDDGRPTEISTWGKRAVRLCEGAASNDQRFAVGWFESDGGVWIVHGPTARLASAGALADLEVDPAAKVTWCGVASAAQDLALTWRAGQKTYLNFCGPKACSSYVAKVPLPADDTFLGFGCVRDSCLYASRDRRGDVALRRVTEAGRGLVVALATAAPDTAVSVVGAGPRSFAIAYVTRERRVAVELRGIDGAVTRSWQFDDEREAPALRWAGDRLLIAFASARLAVVRP